jgi:hypothetical protein
MSGDHNMYANWEPRHERLYKDGVLIHHKVQRTPNGEWEDYVPEEPPPVKKPQPKAFPNMTGQTGMDLRDYFAAQAMQTLIQIFAEDPTVDSPDERREIVAKSAYEQADAMMKAREE